MQESDFSARLVAALAAAWAAIRSRHTDVPPVVITLGAGSIGQAVGELKLGHFAAARWEHPDGVLAELFVGGEGLRHGARQVLATLLHEAAHGAASTRRVQDVSRGGRYHNARYAELARELGLTVARIGDIGWSDTAVPDATAAAYAAELAALGGALTAWRRSERQAVAGGQDAAGAPGEDQADDGEGGEGGSRGGRKSSNNGVAALCGCEPPRRIRVAASVLDAGPVVCGLCDAEFTAA
jgi:hypothetical protein